MLKIFKMKTKTSGFLFLYYFFNYLVKKGWIFENSYMKRLTLQINICIFNTFLAKYNIFFIR